MPAPTKPKDERPGTVPAEEDRPTRTPPPEEEPPTRTPPPEEDTSKKSRRRIRGPEPKTEKPKREVNPPGSVWRRQGFIWVGFVSDGKGGYTKVYRRQPPPGAKIIKGKGSAKKTVFATREDVPTEITSSMGFMGTKTENGKNVIFSPRVRGRTLILNDGRRIRQRRGTIIS